MDPNLGHRRASSDFAPSQQPPPRASHLSAALRLQEEQQQQQQQQRFHPQAHAPHQVCQAREASGARLAQFVVVAM